MTTTARSGWPLAGLGALLIALAVLVSCGSGNTVERQRAYACGTLDRPPVAVEYSRCQGAEPGVAFYSGWADDLDEEDEQVVIGLPLDEDWYDPIAQADLDDLDHGSGHGPRATRSRSATTTTAAQPRPPRKASPTTRPTTRSTR